MALYLPDRFRFANSVIIPQLQKCLSGSVVEACECPRAIDYLLTGKEADLKVSHTLKLLLNTYIKYLLFWTPANPIFSVHLLSEEEKIDKRVLQFAMKSLEYFPVEQVFFYVPQMVQTLRYDKSGYVERFILNTAKTSQLFAHQIIWNMNANMFKDGEGLEVWFHGFLCF